MGQPPGRRVASVFVASCLALAASPQIATAQPSVGPAAVIEPAAESNAPSLKAAILPVRIDGEVSETDRAALTGELVDGLRRGQFAVVAPKDVGDVGQCQDPKCVKSVGSKTGASHVVRARVEVVDRDYKVEVELLDAKSGESIARSSEGCEICGIVDAGAIVSTAAATLRTKLDALAKGPSTLSVVSDPTGAEVRIDGEVVGQTPLDRPVVPGKRVLRVSKEGYIAIEREVTFVEGVQESVSFELDKVPSRLPPRPWGWVSLGVGIASIGGAVAFAVLRDRPYELGGACDGDNRDADGDCRRVWNTEFHVLGFALAGGALTTLGVAILLNSKSRRAQKRSKKSKASAKLGVGPGNLTVRGRF